MYHILANKRKTTLMLGSFLLIITLLAGSMAFFVQGSFMQQNAQPSGTPQEPAGAALPAEEEEDDEAAELDDQQDEVVHYNVPTRMRGVFITPGIDFMKGTDISEAALKAEIDTALESAKTLTMNSVIIETNYKEQVIYRTRKAPGLAGSFDVMDYIVDKSRALGLYTYAVFDVSHYQTAPALTGSLAVGADTLNALAENIREFAETYQVDGILLDGYANVQSEKSYATYTLLGGAIGFDNYMKHSPRAVVTSAAEVLRKYARGTQVGLLADSVWQNQEDNDSGSATKAVYTSLGNGNADTKGFVQEGLLDFVAVKAYGSLTDTAEPFGKVAAWWAEVAQDSNVPMYIVHASDRACTSQTGWQAHDQLAKQVIEIESLSAVRGSMFNSLSRLVADPDQTTTTLIKYYRQEIQAEHILSELEMTRPAKTVYTTTEPVVTFTGASDPNSQVVMNGEVIPTDASGYFTVTRDLVGGENKFSITHKAKTISYTITRNIDIIKDLTPQGSIAADGGMSITVSVLGYPDAKVTASLNGNSVTLTPDDAADESNRDSSYQLFTGHLSVPLATATEQNLGNITVNASWNGQTKSLTGASVKVNKKVKIEDGEPVVVVSDQARTYPANTLDNIPDARYYPLPKGAMDYAVGDEIVYKKGSNTYTYFVLASGLRVESSDIARTNDFASGNAISSLSMTADSGYTYITLKTAQKVSYAVTYNADSFVINFKNTTSVPSGQSLAGSPLFTEASWSGSDTLTLKFVKSNGFMGYKGYYDDSGNLVFRFNNPPASLSGARIAIDPGHGGGDTGALGFLANYPERVINAAIAEYLADELQSRGATVLLLDTSGGMELQARVAKAEAFNADLFVSVHNNSAANSAAQGTEIYYFYPFSKALATSAAQNVSNQLATNNRGAKQSYYHVTLSSQFPSVLVECGFMSNKTEYEKLISSKYQQQIATGIADSLSAAIKSAYTGITASGTSSAGNTGTANSGSSDLYDGVEFELDTVEIEKGRSETLYLYGVDNSEFKWASSNTAVATVSQAGKVTAVGTGKATITATALDDETVSLKCTVTVVNSTDTDEEDEIDTAGALYYSTVSGEETLKVGETLKLNISNRGRLEYESDDNDVATVNSSGTITARGVGDTTIYVIESASGDVAGTWEIEVTRSSSTSTSKNNPVRKAEYIEFENAQQTIYKNRSHTLVLTSDIGEIRNSDLNWKSSNTSVAKVDANGVVTGRATGTVTITAYTSDDEYYATCKVTVSGSWVATTGVSLNRSEITVVKGATNKTLAATVLPSNASDKTVTWSTSSSNFKVDSKGYITGLSVGSGTVFVKTSTGERASCRVTVVRDIEIEEIEIDDSRLELELGERAELTVSFYPQDVADQSVTWKSSNTSVATVDSRGRVTAKGRGEAIITCTSVAEPGCRSTCEIYVY